ncbi:MAG TPA: PadR family transcriptional regulator [Acidobacteriaceae bacterium]
MAQANTTLLGRALLGLLHQKPAAGYDLRKLFAETPMGGFSDSPGSIYPALRRLEEKRLLRGHLQPSSGLRRRRLLSLTPAGERELRSWLDAPLETVDIVARMKEVMLRFAFLDSVLGAEATLRFLHTLHALLAAYHPELKHYLRRHGALMPLSARLALESGIAGYAAQLAWAAHALHLYTRKVAST